MRYNKEYKEITRDILDNEDFLTLKNDNHHGTNRYDHCKRVAYLSYLITKFLRGNYESATKAGLLHDYFHGTSSYLEHPKKSALNAKETFQINEQEESIIETHMYHYALTQKVISIAKKDRDIDLKQFKPTCKEGFIVCISDLLVSIFELGRYKVRYDTCLYVLFIINMFRY